MDLTNDDRRFETDPTRLARSHSLDMALATQTSLPVLISAPLKSALEMAIEIALAGGRVRAEYVMMVDAADNRYLCMTLSRAATAGRGQLRAVVIQDVDRLGRAQQSALMTLMTETSSSARPCRIIATTSVPLFDRVRQGSFDSALFYHLNKIHITSGRLAPQGD
jgi:hypothetical protein